MRENHVRILCSVLKVHQVYEEPDGSLTPFFDDIGDSPLMHSSSLRETLRDGLGSQAAPYLYRDPRDCFFGALRAGDGVLYMGPMCHRKLSGAELRQMLRSYGVEVPEASSLPVYTLPEIRNMLLLTNTVLENASLENEELLQLNRIISRNEQEDLREQTRFLLQEEAENDDDAVRHSYREEQLLMQAIREGRSDDAVRLAESMDRDSGRLSGDYIRHRRNFAIVGIALSARAAIEGGVSPETAYRVSGYYINKCDEAQDPAHMLHHRNRAIEELAGRVAEKRTAPRASSYVEQCQDYVRKHYREKIYLEDAASAFGISPTYLSRLFKKETGKCFQDYINEERIFRASNLLLYSDLSLTEIAHYVGFPNQSYMGKMFKRYRNITPRAYRDTHALRDVEREERNR